jgi:outer membrane receptor protein involved in Fe transport
VDEFRWDVDLTYDKFTLGYRMRYIGKMFTSTYENFRELPTACTPAGCPPLNSDVVEVVEFPAVFYHDLRFEYNMNEKYQFYMGIDNVFDKRAPFGLSGTGVIGATGDRGDRFSGNASIYDAFGRKLYAGFRARF